MEEEARSAGLDDIAFFTGRLPKLLNGLLDSPANRRVESGEFGPLHQALNQWWQSERFRDFAVTELAVSDVIPESGCIIAHGTV